MSLCALLIALFLAPAQAAQDEPALAHVELMVPVASVKRKKGQSTALLDGGRDRGLLATGRGTAYRQDPDVGLMELGPVEVLAVDEAQATVRFLGEGRLEPGDLIELPAAVPEVLLGTLCWDLLSDRISFLDEDGVHLCDERALLAEPGVDHDARAFQHGAEVVAGYAWAAHDMTEPLGEGRFAGRTVEEAMAAATAEDVRDFLLFVASFPGRYIGNTWRLTETWATWAMNSGFTSWREILLRARDMEPEEQAGFLFDLVPTLIEDDMIASWYDASRHAVATEDYDEALVIVDLMGTAARATERPWDWVLYASAHADLLDDMGQHDEGVAAYEYAIEQAADFPYIAAIAANNMGSALYQLGRDEESMAAYQRAIALREGLPAEQTGGMADSWRGIGMCQERLYHYPEALEAYGMALELYRQRTDLTSVEREAATLRDLGDVLAHLGRYTEAIERRREALTRARELGWTSTVARATDDIGASLWDLGRYQEALDARIEAAGLYAEAEDPHAQAIALTNAASLLSLQGRQDEALARFEEALAIHRERDELADVADVLTRAARMQRERRNLAAAADLLQQALAPLEESGAVAARADALLELAEVHQQAGRYPEADVAYQASLEGFQAVGDRHEEARVLEWWAISAHQRRDMAGAKALFERSLTLREELGDLAGQADTLRSLASYEASLAGHYDAALALAARSLAIARQMPSRPAEAKALALEADMLSQTGRFDEAQARYEQALLIQQETGDLVAQAALRDALGQVEVVRGHSAAAIARFREAVDQARASDSRSQLGYSLDSLAWQLAVDGQSDAARAAADEALAILEEAEDEWGLGNIYNTLGTLDAGLADYRTAREWHEKALAIRRSWQDPFGEAGSLNNIGTIYMDLGDWERAVPYFEQSIEVGRRVHFIKVLTISVGNLAQCFIELGQPEKALALADEALATAARTDQAALVPELTMLRGRALQGLGRVEEARASMEQALALAEELDLLFVRVRIRTRLGILAWEQGDLDRAVAALQTAVETASPYPAPGLQWTPRFYLGRAQRDLGRREEAVTSFRAAVDALERMKAGLGAGEQAEQGFEANHSEVYRELVDLLNQLGKTEEAWQVLGLMKSQELEGSGPAVTAESVAEGDRGALAEIQALRARERDLERRLREELSKPAKERSQDLLGRLQQDLDEAQLRFQDYTRDLETSHPDLFQRLQVAPPSFYKLQADLLPNEAFIEPVILPDRIATFVVRGGSSPLLVRETPVDEAEVDRLIVALRAALEDRSAAWGPTRGARAMTAAQVAPREDPLVTSEALFKLLIAPILPDLTGIDTLIVSPSGRLRYLPFAALWDGQGYLVERYRIALLTQAGALTEHRPMEPRSTLLALGNPDGSLPGAEQEIEALGQIWRSKDLLALLGQDATKQALRGSLEGRRILHLATHGRLLNDNPEGSYLLLAGEGAAAHLTFREIPLLPLNDVDLVVLSACQTALGEQGEGKEIAGLAYQFEMRGAAAVLATLWEVDDASTTGLMSTLYGELERQGGTRADLLRNSQLALLHEEATAHPYHWAPFVLIGDWR